MGVMVGVGVVVGLVVVGVVGRRVGKNRIFMQVVGVGINGFGRIGRQVVRIVMKDLEIDLKLINVSYDFDYLVYMMKYDIIYGKYDGIVEVDGDFLVVDGQKIVLFYIRDLVEIFFGEYGVEYVCEFIGVFLIIEKVQGYLKVGVKKVIFFVFVKDDFYIIVMGVNEDIYELFMECVFCVFCIINGLVLVVRVL